MNATISRTYTDITFTTKQVPDYDADISYLADENNYLGLPSDDIARYMAQDKERIDAYNNGEWDMVGVIVTATLTDDNGREESFSDSLWGIESDSGDYFKDVEQDLTREVIHQLHKFGIEDSFIAEHSPAGSYAHHIATERN